ncbi:MAG TPA: SusD/RagB family nutrient-binding outer membrane lipoprotein, partial [Longimicrobiaceae bacterium]|nr:SusD/RagB family nutrient-binding outer membrane lipoprotein [Longimicrobiaceae bacterium]
AAKGWIAGNPATLYQAAIRASMQQYGISPGAIDAYLAQPAVAYQGLQSIWVRRWVALFGGGAAEAWALVRRTGVPNLTPAVAGQQIPARLYYPDQERLYNPTNYKTVTLWTPMWWMK